MRNFFLLLLVCTCLGACRSDMSEARRAGDAFIEAYLIEHDQERYMSMMTESAIEQAREEIERKRKSDEKSFLTVIGKIRAMQFHHSFIRKESAAGDRTAGLVYEISSDTDTNFSGKMLLLMIKDASGVWKIEEFELEIH